MCRPCRHVRSAPTGRARPQPHRRAARTGRQSGREKRGSVVLAIFNGLLFQALLDPRLAIEGKQRDEALARLREVLPAPARAMLDVSIRPPREPA